jgi:hypothetical protein
MRASMRLDRVPCYGLPLIDKSAFQKKGGGFPSRVKRSFLVTRRLPFGEVPGRKQLNRSRTALAPDPDVRRGASPLQLLVAPRSHAAWALYEGPTVLRGESQYHAAGGTVQSRGDGQREG